MSLPTPRNIVEELIIERAPRLASSIVWPVARPLLYSLLGYGRAVRMAQAIEDLSGDAALEYISRLLSLEVVPRGVERLPATGRCVVICNHPTGIADGIAVYDCLRRVRSDITFFANADALRVNPRFADVLIPVEWVEAKRTREKTRTTLNAARAAFESEKCVVLFPAGRLARRGANGQLSDPPWQTTALSLAQKYNAPLVPMHLSGPNSVWFHAFNRVSQELRDITLFHEFLNKAGKRFDLTVGPVMASQQLDDEAALLCERLKTYIERELPLDPDRPAL
ncbi:GNAT family N-acetyltransferase [Asticcacaulis excentricus]|uniref:Phospholipid/glycerol acyltransferase n=1 Tax=Asticcacaulis excentricus (strain ATCC 15261 / DSM 4724 / KCTC 12464 / NCIMB 9791 / VKM B-1370 / CB 48) TaxID=573065 RepID=E8RNE9_ASTEC|nr:1-acyl-sn-glycerol-3-phosphate acyltransferase [Asticcacaulis excentricus]ADU11780.1 phospholipid/glycerol acyltransferase [Asticcacaulis excentricus CB 48]